MSSPGWIEDSCLHAFRGQLGEQATMMPLSLASPGEENLIHRVGGSPEVRKHLENLGFVAGGTTTVITTMGGNLIVKVKDARVAISNEMAQKIMVQ